MLWLFLTPYGAGEGLLCSAPILESSSERGVGESLIEATGDCQRSICEMSLAGRLLRWKRKRRCKPMADFTAQSKNWKCQDRVDCVVYIPYEVPLCPLRPDTHFPQETQQVDACCWGQRKVHHCWWRNQEWVLRNASDWQMVAPLPLHDKWVGRG